MSVSNVFYESSSFSPAIPALPQFRESHQENHFDGRNVIILDSHESLVRASTFIKYLARNLNAPKGSKSSLQALLERSLHLPTTEENKSLFSEITEAFFKQNGYLSRLFSNESWKEWFENRSALGKVASQFRNCIDSRAEVCSFTKEMHPQLIQKANEEASVLLKGLGSHEVTRASKSSCLFGLTSGITASFLLENPLFLLMGLSECFPRAYTQQKVGNEFQVNTYTTSDQWLSLVASFPNGNFVVTWESRSQDGSGFGIFGQLFDEMGNKIGNEFPVNTYTINEQYGSSTTSLSNDKFVVTWQSCCDGDVGIFSQLFDENGNKIGSEFLVNTYTINWQERPFVASLNNRNFVVTWNSINQDGDVRGIFGQLFDENSTKISNEFQINTYTNNNQRMSSVTNLINDNFVVTWASYVQDGSGYGVFSQLYDANANKIGSEFQVNTYTTLDQWYSTLVDLSNGNFVVTWASDGQDGSGYGVYGQLFDVNANKIGSEFQVNTFTNNSQFYPDLASFSNGNFIIVWESNGQDGSEYGVYGQLFDGNGTKLGSEFRANTYTTKNQWFPSVACFSNGNFVVTWSSWLQDGSRYGVYGQIFNDFLVSSTTSPTKTISSTTSSVSSSTMSAGRTRTSVNPSSSITVSSTTRPITTSNRATLSATSDQSNRFSWIWFLLWGVGSVSCLGLTGYFIFKSRDRKKDSDVHAFALGEREQTDGSTAETQYQRTPDFVTAGRESDYQLTPDFVSAGDGRD